MVKILLIRMVVLLKVLVKKVRKMNSQSDNEHDGGGPGEPIRVRLRVRLVSSFNKIKFVLVGGIVKTKYNLNVFNNIAALDFKYKHNRRIMSTHCFYR